MKTTLIEPELEEEAPLAEIIQPEDVTFEDMKWAAEVFSRDNE